ncbi:VWA domain-containing protein [Paludisphaera rhizosphaerae]|uniref:VWA domain-containing protein n=1 Tax=Paludisphaera rhizosphaerae TaxID=2711216 RepID=UPI0013ED9B03|nr:VWA domain-containing protein [Paludisphaera rhizosphaerae]
MDFEHPRLLWLLLGLPPLALWAWRGARLRARGWDALGQWGAAPSDRSIGVLLAMALAVLALARPRIGFGPDDQVGPGRDVVLAFDVSRSMAAEDAAPNRLGLAVETAKTLVDVLARESSNRAGVVAFAGRGVLRCPLTQNMGAVVDAMNRLRPGDVKPGGTDLAAAIDAAVDAFDPNAPEDEPRTVVIFSDGEDHEGRWEQAVDRAEAKGVVVHTIALGDAKAGARLSFTYRGEPVVSKRIDETLAAIAERSGGASLKLGLSAADLGLLYRERIEPVAEARRRAARAADRPERFPLLLAASLGVLAAALRPGVGARRPRRARAVARLAVLALAVSQVAAESPPETAPQAVARGQSLYEAGRFEDALHAFQDAAARAPGRPVPLYNLGATLYQLGRYPQAVLRYQEARLTADPALRTKIDYALGNAILSLGDLAAAVRCYDACLSSTAWAPGLDVIRRDAAVNRAFALQRLREALAQQDQPNPEDGNQPTPPDANRGSGDAKQEEGPGDGPDGRSDAPPPGPGETRETDSSSPRKRGGAGGDAPNPPGANPDDRLDAALDRIRDARRRRLPDQPPPDESPRGDGKDW